MKIIKKEYVIYLLLILMLSLVGCSSNRLEMNFDGYGFCQDVDGEIGDFQTKKVKIIIDAYVNDNNINNDTIEISYDGIRITENILFNNNEDNFWTGNIVRYDNVNAEDEIIGDIVLLNKGVECFISLYNENLDIVAPVDDIEIAIQKYFDFYVKSSEYKLK